jgi:rhodanese-related sulfurtransferase
MIPELSPTDVRDLLDGQGAPLLLDVREPWELSLAALPQAINIPMAQLPDRLDELDRSREIVVMCHHGSRSLQVAVFLRHSGFDSVFNLAGGIDAWSADVDPGVPLY